MKQVELKSIRTFLKEGNSAEQVAEKKTATASKSAPKAAAVKNAPAKKINTPRKMA